MISSNSILVTSLVILNVGCVFCGNIIAILPTQNLDHFVIGESVVKGLLAKGHNLTIMSRLPPTELTPFTYEYVNLSSCPMLEGPPHERYFADESVELNLAEENYTCTCIANRAEYQNLEMEEYDLLVVSMEYHSCFLRLAHPLNVPVVWIVPTNQNIMANRLAGEMDPLHPIFKYKKFYDIISQFNSRAISVWNYLTKYAYHWQIQRYVDKINRKILPKASHIKDDVDLVLYNTHFTLFPRAHVPNVVEIAGVHIEEPKIMCPRVGQFIDDAENGVIFISTPTQQPYRQMFEEKMQTFEISFLRVLQSVLWKRSTALAIPNYNLFWSERLPQREILNHTNVIVFIGCATLNNIYEAVYSGTPFLGIVCSNEEDDHMNRLEELGVGVKVPYASLNEVTVVNAINLIWQQKSYGEKMQKLSAAFNDRTMTPLNTAVYWAEYAIKHGASHLKSESSKIPLYTYLFLDIGPISMVLLAVLFVLYMLLYIEVFFWMKRKIWPSLKSRILSYFFGSTRTSTTQ